MTLEKLKTIPGRGLYLTRSAYLVDNARSLYFASGYSNEGQEVDFLSVAELLETIEVPRGREATWADFAAWYDRIRSLFKLKDPHRPDRLDVVPEQLRVARQQREPLVTSIVDPPGGERLN